MVNPNCMTYAEGICVGGWLMWGVSSRPSSRSRLRRVVPRKRMTHHVPAVSVPTCPLPWAGPRPVGRRSQPITCGWSWPWAVNQINVGYWSATSPIPRRRNSSVLDLLRANTVWVKATKLCMEIKLYERKFLRGQPGSLHKQKFLWHESWRAICFYLLV